VIHSEDECREIMAANGWSLRDLYRTLETPGTNRLRDAQAALDSAVRSAYGMMDNEDTLAFLLKLNLDLAAKESAGESVTPPGLPTLIPHSEHFITPDCIHTV
jgi:hypothetical protein